MNRWITYIKERFPLPVYFLLTGGIVLSGLYFSSGHIDLKIFLLSFAGLLIFFANLRLMDEYKDFEKDKLANPTRPLPRGLISIEEAYKGILFLTALLFAWSALTYFVVGFEGALALFVTSIWLWLMFKEFYLGQWLVDRPLLYAISHQVILLPIVFYPIFSNTPSMMLELPVVYLGVSILGSFFCYEICRKLDPNAHPILKTYLYMYGPTKTSALVAVLSFVAAMGACHIGLGKLLWPFEGLLILSLSLLFINPQKFKIVEAIATLSLLAHLWGYTLYHFLGGKI